MTAVVCVLLLYSWTPLAPPVVVEVVAADLAACRERRREVADGERARVGGARLVRVEVRKIDGAAPVKDFITEDAETGEDTENGDSVVSVVSVSSAVKRFLDVER